MIALIEIPKCCTAMNVWRSPSPSAVSRRDCRRAGQAEALSEGSRSAVDGGGVVGGGRRGRGAGLGEEAEAVPQDEDDLKQLQEGDGSRENGGRLG